MRKLQALNVTACGRWPSNGTLATTSTKLPLETEGFLCWRSHQPARPALRDVGNTHANAGLRLQAGHALPIHPGAGARGDSHSITLQRVFDVVLSEAQPGRHPLTVHSRGAEKDVVCRLADAGLPAVLHWYTGPINLIEQALQAGLYFSINIAMVRSRKFQSLMSAIPRDRILLETDGPYAKHRGRPAQPAGMNEVATALGKSWGLDLIQTTNVLGANQTRFLNRS